MIDRLPSWFTQEIPGAAVLDHSRMLERLGINTVCQQAKCPNLNRCFTRRRLTFLILGRICTRECRFCSVLKSKKRAGSALDHSEPRKVSFAVGLLRLDYAVITSVTRDDLPDGGAGQFARTLDEIHADNPGVRIEVLVPDFAGSKKSLAAVISAAPEVVSHNIETVPRLYESLRPKADYRRSLALLADVKKINPRIITKSSLMLGLGEKKEEVLEVMRALRDVSCDALTLGQYLAPSSEHYPVREFISIGHFDEYREIGLGLGFREVLSGPLVRSSYQAQEVHDEVMRGIYA